MSDGAIELVLVVCIGALLLLTLASASRTGGRRDRDGEASRQRLLRELRRHG